MRAIILSAGQGRRLAPLTDKVPKCLLPVRGSVSVLEMQLRVLAACGVPRATVVVGFAAEEVEHHLTNRAPKEIEVESLYNPFFESTDNLVTAWLTRERMTEDFLLLNGDTLFEPQLLKRVLDAPRAPATMAIDRKPAYDEDDMKVSLDKKNRVCAVAKTLPRDRSHAEAIGMIRFGGLGGPAFVEGLERSVRDKRTHRRYYLSVMNENAERGRRIDTVSVEGLWWQEIDSPEDLARAQHALAEGQSDPDHFARTGVSPPIFPRTADAS